MTSIRLKTFSFAIGGVCIDEEHLLSIEAEISNIAKDIFGDARLSADTEFHASDLYHRRKNFIGMTDPTARIAVFDKFLRILSKEEVALIDIQINTSKIFGSQSASDIAFMFLCERANGYITSRRSLGMLIGDRESDEMSERFSTDLFKYRARGTDFAFGTDIKNLFESVHFTHSHLSRFLQLADIYTWLLLFLNKNRHSKEPKHQLLLETIRQKDINLFPSTYKEWPK